MKILIQQAHIIDPQSSHHGKVRDILIEGGQIREIAEQINVQPDRLISAKGLHVSQGWVDIFSNFCDPGYEFKETLETGAAAAAAGAFTDVFIIPNTKPAIDTKAQVEYIRQKSKWLPVSVHPMGAITKNLEGKELAEMYDMHSSGAVAFADGLNPVQSAGVLLKALQYVKAFNGVIIQIPDDKSIGANGLINEGIISTRLGLPGKPALAEELSVARDIKLARYAESKIHFTGISSPKSLEYVKRAKDAGLEVTCSVSPAHLFFNDEDLLNYDTNLKVYPPLRTKMMAAELRKAVLDGTVDCIASHHLPHEFDSKVLEFEYAKFGMTGLETVYAAMKTYLPELSEEKLNLLLSQNPRRIFSLPQDNIEAGKPCQISLFLPDSSWTYTESMTRSKSKNSPLLNRQLKGRPLGVINGEQMFLND
ncbi:MAG: dihydroorotase [Chitinophagales bacterium]